MGFSQARILEWVSDFLFQGIFATQGRNTSLLLDRQIPYPLAIQWKLILSSYMKSSRRPSGPREAVFPFACDVDSLGWAPAIAAPCHVMSCPKKLPWSYCCVIGVAFKGAECNYPKIGRGGVQWPVDRFSALTDEKKRIVGEVSWGPYGHRETRTGKEKDVGKKVPRFTLFISSCYRSVTSSALWAHGLQHARLPCPSLSPGVCALFLFFILIECYIHA